MTILGEDLVDEILSACRAGPRSEQELIKLTGASRPTVAAKIVLLDAHGLLGRALKRTGGTGRPPIRWTARATDAVDDLEKAADAFVLELLEGQAAEFRAATTDDA